MRTQRATRYNHEMQHASFGIANWFLSKGVKNQDVMKECMYAFCQKEGCAWLTNKTTENALIGYIQPRFQKFATFAIPYLKENNYL